jgi:hypothetical protein
LSGIAIVMTIGVYGLVAAIVKLDDGGLYLSELKGEGATRRIQRALGRGVLSAAPYMMKSLSVIGTVAMFLVGGGILTHGLPVLHHAIENATAQAASVVGGLSVAMPMLLNAVAGIIAGGIVLLVVTGAGKIWRLSKA